MNIAISNTLYFWANREPSALVRRLESTKTNEQAKRIIQSLSEEWIEQEGSLLLEQLRTVYEREPKLYLYEASLLSLQAMKFVLHRDTIRNLDPERFCLYSCADTNRVSEISLLMSRDLYRDHHGKLHYTARNLGRALVRACEAGSYLVAEHLIRRGADVNFTVTYEDETISGLSIAIENNFIDIVDLLLASGATRPE